MEIIALDIETETGPCHDPGRECCTRRGLDPSVTPITVVSITDSHGSTVFRSDELGEDGLLLAVDTALMGRTGFLVTWNGAAFDLPFLVERSLNCGVDLGLELAVDESIEVKYQPLPGHTGAYRGRWYGLDHVDVQFAYRRFAVDNEVKWGLKSVAVAMGMSPVEVDRAMMHTLTPAELDAYVSSDTTVTRELAIRVGDLEAWSDATALEQMGR